MFGGLMKKLPGAVLESIDKMKGSMLLSMAKGMTAHDAETMARHWGYVPDVTPSQQVKAFQKERTDVIAETIIPERPTTPAIEALLKSMNEKDSVKVPALEITEILTGDISKEASITPSDDTLRTMDVVINDERMIEKTIADESLIIHPIFGKKIVDLGYKTVYLTSVSLLAKTQVWERQRTLRPDRAARIASSKIALGRAKSLSGVITMFCDKSSGQSGIVDGQHRAGALMMLAQQGHWEGHEMNILIDVFETQNDDEITALFKEINSAEPVRLVDMPGEGASAALKNVLDSAVADLCEEYPEMFKPSLRCKPPHLHEAIFRDDIFQSEVITRRGLKTAAELREFMLSANKDYSPRSDSQWEQIVLDSKLFKSSGKSLSEAIKKARANKFYLGLDNSWMHQS